VQRGRRGLVEHRAQVHAAGGEVEAGDLGQQHADVRVALEDRAQRVGDLGRGQRAGRHLVGQRLEEVEVAPVDERDLDIRPGEPQRRLQASEAAADDHDRGTRASVRTHGRGA
jgi:hypothetical protein